jgi:SnoaL-like domain
MRRFKSTPGMVIALAVLGAVAGFPRLAVAGQYVVDDGGQLRSFRGPEQLAGLAGGPDCAVTRTAPRMYLSHVAENLVIEAWDRGAKGTSYALYPGRKGKVFQPEVAGQVGLYHDEFVRTAKGWRLKLRRHEVSPEGATAN